MASNKRKPDDSKLYIVQYEFILNGTEYTVGQPMRICTRFKGTNSKNSDYLPEDMVEMMIAKGAIKSYALCD
jgi:hypothetical protein